MSWKTPEKRNSPQAISEQQAAEQAQLATLIRQRIATLPLETQWQILATLQPVQPTPKNAWIGKGRN